MENVWLGLRVEKRKQRNVGNGLAASEILGGISKPVDRLMETPVEST